MNHLAVLTRGLDGIKPGFFSTTPEIDALRERGRPSTPAEWRAQRKGAAPGARVGGVVKVYERAYEGRPGQPYFLARVVSVAPDAIRVVAAHRKETLTHDEWDARAREHDEVWDSFLAIVPYSVSHPEPPPLPPGVHADAASRTVVRHGLAYAVAKTIGVAMAPVAIGAAVGRWNPEIGTRRGALTGLGTAAGLVGGKLAGSDWLATFGSAAGGAVAWKFSE